MSNRLSSFVACLAGALCAFHPRISVADDNCVSDSAVAFQNTFHEELETIDALRFMRSFCPSAETQFGIRSLPETPVIQVGAEEKSAAKACAQGDEKYFENRLRKSAWTLLPKEKALEIAAACVNQGDAPVTVAVVVGDAIQITIFYHPKDTETAQVQTPAAKRWSPPNSVDVVDDSKLDGALIGRQGVGATYTRKPTARGSLVFSVNTTRGPSKVSIVGDELLGAKISGSGKFDDFACFVELPGKQKIRLNPEGADFHCSTDLSNIGDCTQDFLNGRCFVEYGYDLVVKSGMNRITFVKDKWDLVPAAGGWRCERNGLALAPTLKFSQAANIDSASYLAKTYQCAGKFTKNSDLK